MLNSFKSGSVEQQGQMLQDMDFYYRDNAIGPFDSGNDNFLSYSNPFSQIREYIRGYDSKIGADSEDIGVE